MDGYKIITEASAETKKSQRSTWSQLQAIADMKFTYVAACQNYGEQKRQSHHNAAEILKLMLKYVTYLEVLISHHQCWKSPSYVYKTNLSVYHL